MQKIPFLVLIMFSGGSGFAQALTPSYSQISKTPFFNSHDFISKEEDIEGSPLLFENWRSGKIILKDHKQYDDVLLNFIPSANKFYINQHDTIRELVASVDEIRIKDVSHPDDRYYDRIFKNNLQGGELVKPGTFVEVLATGKIVMVKEYVKRTEGAYSDGIVTFLKKYVLHSTIFVINNNDIMPVRLNVHFLEKLTSDRKDQMKEFLKSKKINLKREADFKEAISYYNYISALLISKKILI